MNKAIVIKNASTIRIMLDKLILLFSLFLLFKPHDYSHV